MNNPDKLLRAFIEASGFDVQEIKEEFYKGEFKGLSTEIHERVVDYKVTKKAKVLHCDKCNRDTSPMGNQ